MITTMSNNIEYNKRFRVFVAILSVIILLSIILPIVTSAEKAAVYGGEEGYGGTKKRI